MRSPDRPCNSTRRVTGNLELDGDPFSKTLLRNWRVCERKRKHKASISAASGTSSIDVLRLAGSAVYAECRVLEGEPAMYERPTTYHQEPRALAGDFVHLRCPVRQTHLTLLLAHQRMAVDPPTEYISDIDRRLVERKLLTSVGRRTEKLRFSL